MICCFLDCETTGLLPTEHKLIEIGIVLWSTTLATVIEQWSTLVHADSNEAESINHIPVAALADAYESKMLLPAMSRLMGRADVVLAHRAEFDRGFVEATWPGLADKRPWACTKYDVDFPLSKSGDSLVQVAISHGVPVVEAHRALTDCVLLRRIFERCVELGHDVDAMLAKAMRPRALYLAHVSYDDREKAKLAGFGWDGATKRWTKRIAIEDAGQDLGFKISQVTA